MLHGMPMLQTRCTNNSLLCIRLLLYRHAPACCLLYEGCKQVVESRKKRLESSRMLQITLEAEISREQIPLRNAYRHVGQKASVRVNSGIEYTVPGERLRAINVLQALGRVIACKRLHPETP